MLALEAERAAVVAAALAWLGTPFHWGARVPGAGVDCGHLIAAVFEGAGLVPAGALRWDAPPDWYLHQARDPWFDALAPWCRPIDGAGAERVAVGDIVTFAIGRSRGAHGGIVVGLRDGAPVLCHADRGTGVTLDTLTPQGAWTARVSLTWRLTRWLDA